MPLIPYPSDEDDNAQVRITDLDDPSDEITEEAPAPALADAQADVRSPDTRTAPQSCPRCCSATTGTDAPETSGAADEGLRSWIRI